MKISIDSMRRRLARNYNALRKKHDGAERICPWCDHDYEPVLSDGDWDDLHYTIAILLSIFCDEVLDDLNCIEDVNLIYYGDDQDNET